jgi:cell division transport system ATP-binding protein
MLILENVCKTYSSGFPALNNISLRVEKGEFVFIVGQSGAGKSTLIKLLLKELEPTSGHIFINGKNLGRAKRRELPLIRRDMGVVFQDFRLLEDRNIYDNIAFAQKVIEVPNRRIRSEVLSMLSMVGLLEKYRNFPSQLSGGEQQRAAIARLKSLTATKPLGYTLHTFLSDKLAIIIPPKVFSVFTIVILQ